jgi:hypothetical protein
MPRSSRPPQHNAKDKLAAECRICRYQFSTGILGWDKHIGAIEKHPNWHPEITNPSERQAQYAAEFPEFFKDARTADRRLAPQNRISTPPPGSLHATPGSYAGLRSVARKTQPNGLTLVPELPPPVAEAKCPTCGGPVQVHFRSTVP